MLRYSSPPLSLTWLAVLFVSLLISQGCEPEVEPSGQSSTAAPAPPPVPTPPPPPAKIKGPSLSAIAVRIAGHVKEHGGAGRAQIKKLAVKLGPARKAVLALYPKGALRYYKRDGNLTEDGLAVMGLLRDLDRHGISRQGYRLDQIDKETEAVVQAFARERRALFKAGSDAGVARVVAAIATWVHREKGGEIWLVRAAGDGLSGAQRKGISEQLSAILKAATETQKRLWTADVAISAAVVRYVVDMLWAKPSHPHHYTSPSEIRQMQADKAKEIHKILKDSLGRTAEVMRGIWPSHPQYKLLLRAVDRYAALVAKGGWKKLPPMRGKKVELRSKGPFVLALRDRLVAEGYRVKTGVEVFDKELNEGVITWQKAHQLTGDGVIGKRAVREFDVSAEQRLRQLRLALCRLREGIVRDPVLKHFFFVNVAAQRLFVYENGKVVREHRVIVGKDNDDIDYSTKRKGKINRSRLFKATMTKVTLAPRWYPTPRVIDLELGPALAKDPNYYEKHGYVSEMNADGTETVYQSSGKGNLLGVVKFQFPNKHAIYMHDTPSRFLFKRSLRAYSHGCIRLQYPRQLAYYVLGREGRGYTRRKINEIIKQREEKIIFLKKKIPVYIDYVSAGVTDKGTVRFYSDVYQYDQSYYAGQLPVQEIEEYKPSSFKGIKGL